MPMLKSLCTSNHHFLLAKALPPHPHPDSSLTQLSKEKQSCLNTIAFNPSFNRIAELSLKQAKYSFSDLQDSKTEEENTSSNTYHVSSRTGYARTQEQSSQALTIASLPLEHYFVSNQSIPLIFCLTWNPGWTVHSLKFLA